MPPKKLSPFVVALAIVLLAALLLAPRVSEAKVLGRGRRKKPAVTDNKLTGALVAVLSNNPDVVAERLAILERKETELRGLWGNINDAVVKRKRMERAGQSVSFSR